MWMNGTVHPATRSSYQWCAVLHGIASIVAPAASRRSRASSRAGSGDGPPRRIAAGRDGICGTEWISTGMCSSSSLAGVASISLRKKSAVASGPMPPITPSMVYSPRRSAQPCT